MFISKHCRRETNYIDFYGTTNYTTKTKFIFVLRKLPLKNVILTISNLSMADTMKKTQNYQINFAESKVAILPHRLLEKSNENTYLSSYKPTNAFDTQINLLHKKIKLTTKCRHHNKYILLHYDSKD